jgi:hypothetical protein
MTKRARELTARALLDRRWVVVLMVGRFGGTLGRLSWRTTAPPSAPWGPSGRWDAEGDRRSKGCQGCEGGQRPL